MSLLCRDNIESLARRGESASNVPVALCTTEFRCLLKRSLGSDVGVPGSDCEMKTHWRWGGGGV